MTYKQQFEKLKVGESLRFPKEAISRIRVLASIYKRGTGRKYKVRVAGEHTILTRLRDDHPGSRFNMLRGMKVGQEIFLPAEDYNKIHGSAGQLDGEWEIVKVTKVKRIK